MSDREQIARRRKQNKNKNNPNNKTHNKTPNKNKQHGLFAVRRGQRAFVYVNRCPHEGAELEYAKDRFLSADGLRVICFAHSAQFDIETGTCIAGPCLGEALTAVPADIIDGKIMIAADA